jgi:hypothetical protein
MMRHLQVVTAVLALLGGAAVGGEYSALFDFNAGPGFYSFSNEGSTAAVSSSDEAILPQ